MNVELTNRLSHILAFGSDLSRRAEIEARYPKRTLPSGAEVTRFCPSPTGFVHIGAIFTAQICQFVAHQSRGVYILRIEDTDKKREVLGAKDLIARQLAAFGVAADEGLQADGSVLGDYGPYVQSERQSVYMAYALDLLKKGRAYPCFATAEELQAAVADQQSKKQRPGYYGEWALWRDRPDKDVYEALQQGKPFVLRFRSNGSHQKRVLFEDVLKGRMEVPQNDLDVPLIKSDEWRLPTYHLAHVVDDYLMRVTLVMRGEEWLSSTPLHIELCEALDIEPFRYAHTPVISIMDTGGKRKLSKRKDPEADVAYWHQAAYPLKSVRAYLLGLANSNFEAWYRDHPDADISEFTFSLDRLKTARSPLLDMKKLEDYAKDEIARMPQEAFNEHILSWAEQHDRALFDAMQADPEYTARVLAIERNGEKPRKDIAKLSDASTQFWYFFDELFLPQLALLEQSDEHNPFRDIAHQDSSAAATAFLALYDHSADKDTWFENLKKAAQAAGYCLDRQALKEHPERYKGSLSDFAQIIRVKTTGKTRTPDLWTIMQILGEERVRARLSA